MREERGSEVVLESAIRNESKIKVQKGSFKIMGLAILRRKVGCQCGTRYVLQDVHAAPDGEWVMGELRTFPRRSD